MKIFKSNFGVGALILLLSGLVCKALGALFRLPLTNLLGIEGIGMFQLVMSLYAFALVLTSGGVTNSLSKLISSARARGQFQKISTYLWRALFVAIGIGTLIGLVFFFFGGFISNFQGIGQNKSYLLFLVMLPLGAGLAVFRGFFQGYENMLPTAIS
ncbi:MAG: oligosaccharide flippase family protein, partial [Candidatus Caccovivens sp.]